MYDYKFKNENVRIALECNLVGSYEIPEIKPTNKKCEDFIGFNYAKTSKQFEKGIHFFLDDYQFQRIWNNHTKYIEILKKFKCVLSPDFSLFADFPLPLQIYNHYRKHLLAAYWQNLGLNVVPTICWSDERSFDWCFDGEPINSVVAISSVGIMNNKHSKIQFLSGYNEMMSRLNPEKILFYGKIPQECKGNIIEIKPYYTKFERNKDNGR